MEIDYDENELVIEFSGKILGKDYPQLISRETKCDVTMDIQCDDISGLASYINGNVKSHRQYVS